MGSSIPKTSLREKVCSYCPAHCELFNRSGPSYFPTKSHHPHIAMEPSILYTYCKYYDQISHAKSKLGIK